MPAPSLTLTAVPGIPLVEPGDDLAEILIAALESARLMPAGRDVLVVAQKIVSKAENRYLDLGAVTPSERARGLARDVDKDPRLVEVILSESEEVVAHKPGVLVVAHKLGLVLANAGVDRSNLAPQEGAERVLLLPKDPDASAAALRTRLEARYGVKLGVIVSDSVGRAWRNGVTGIALGAAGLPALRDMIGRKDLFGRTLDVTQTGFADEIAAAAALLMGQADEGLPLVLLRGLNWAEPATDGRALLRPKVEDLFR
ncbi:MAG: coenzyme F420-0:L-glutamate ligase [Kiloniellales bacterium]|jgi:coenzyme F420-0:L-glutamate ligase/coenzyme F420-1:gamma-L-glutamate ligase